MKKVSRSISLLLLCAMMLTIGFSFGASADIEKNEWRGIKWEYDTLIDAVTIHCTGVAPVSKDMPWKDRAADITAFVFDSGVTEIPAGFSDGCVNMDAIKIPATTRVIGEGVLTVGNLTDVWYEGNWESFTQIKMSDEDFAAALKAKFHGSRIVVLDDGTVLYEEIQEGGEEFKTEIIDIGDGSQLVIVYYPGGRKNTETYIDSSGRTAWVKEYRDDAGNTLETETAYDYYPNSSIVQSKTKRDFDNEKKS